MARMFDPATFVKRKTTLVAFVLLVLGAPIGRAHNPYTGALKTAMAEFPSENPAKAAQILFDRKAVTFIQAGGFSIHFPGMNRIGFEEIVRRYRIVFFATSDSPADDEEALLSGKAYTYAQAFNKEMLSLLLKSGSIRIFEIEYEILSDAAMELNYPAARYPH